MDLSIVVPVFNQEECLSYGLDSIINRNLQNLEYEIIIVNDGSTDNSEAIANEYKKKYGHIRLINQSNKGVSVARNVGVEQAQGTYVYFFDPDDYLLPQTLDLLLEYANRYNTDIITFLSSDTNKRPAILNHDSASFNEEIEVYDGVEYLAEEPFRVEPWWYIINRQFLLESGVHFIEGRWLEDAIFTPELFIRASRVAHVPHDGHRYVQHANSALGTMEPKVYHKLIEDLEFAICTYNEIIGRLRAQNENAQAIQRLLNKQGSLVFFLIIRLIRSDLNFRELSEILDRLEKLNCYPIRHFIGKDYNRAVYKILVRIINNKILLRMAFLSFRWVGKYFVQ